MLWNVNHWLHLLGAIAAIGSAITLRLAILPALNGLEGDVREEFEKTVRRKLTPIVHGSILVLLITGFANLARVTQTGLGEQSGLYLALFVVKVTLSFGIFYIAAMLTVASPSIESFQTNRGRWLFINIGLGAVVVFIAAYLRWMPHGG